MTLTDSRLSWRKAKSKPRCRAASYSNIREKSTLGGRYQQHPVFSSLCSFISRRQLPELSLVRHSIAPISNHAAILYDNSGTDMPRNTNSCGDNGRPGYLRKDWNFRGEIHVIDSKTSFIKEKRALTSLLADATSQPFMPDGYGYIGIDTETRVNFGKPMGTYKTSLLQLASSNTCVIYRLEDIRSENKHANGSAISYLLQKLLLSSANIFKAGIGSLKDMTDLAWEEQEEIIEIASVVDLDSVARTLPEVKGKRRGKDVFGLKSLAEAIAPHRGKVAKSKKITTSNWEKPLSEKQLLYAANDAWLGSELTQLLLDKIRRTGRQAMHNQNWSSQDLQKLLLPLSIVNHRKRSVFYKRDGPVGEANFVFAKPPPSIKNLTRPKSFFHKIVEDMLAEMKRAKREWAVTPEILEPRDRYTIHNLVRRHENLFSVTLLEKKQILIFRLDFLEPMKSLQNSIQALRKFLGSEEERATIPVLGASAWPEVEKGQDLSVVYMGRQANRLLRRVDTVVMCERNSENPDEMVFWKLKHADVVAK